MGGEESEGSCVRNGCAQRGHGPLPMEGGAIGHHAVCQVVRGGIKVHSGGLESAPPRVTVCCELLSPVQLCDPMDYIACQAPLPMEFTRQE